MARINIEDSIRSDVRFMNLVVKLGSYKLALGELVHAWMVAQRHYLTAVNDRCIPFNEWQRQECCDLIIAVGLAEKREKGVYICGSEAQFKWLTQRSEAGKWQREEKPPVEEATVVERPLNDRSTVVDGRLTSYLSSPFSNSKDLRIRGSVPQRVEEKALAVVPPAPPAVDAAPVLSVSRAKPKPDGNAVKRVMAAYIDALRGRYGGEVRWRPRGQDTGVIQRLLTTSPENELIHLLQAYLQMEDPWYQKMAYDLVTFERQKGRIQIHLSTGSGDLENDAKWRRMEKAVMAEEDQTKQIMGGEDDGF